MLTVPFEDPHIYKKKRESTFFYLSLCRPLFETRASSSFPKEETDKKKMFQRLPIRICWLFTCVISVPSLRQTILIQCLPHMYPQSLCS